MQVSRRSVLITVGALTVLGAGVVFEEHDDPRARRLLHRLGVLDSPDHRVADAGTPQVNGKLASEKMGTSVSWTLSMPRSPITGVVYCLHGRGNDQRMAFDDIHLPDVVAAAGGSLAVAAVDGGSDSYWHARASGIDPLGMFLDEFVPMVEARIGPQDNRALLGWSMGGYGALLAAQRAPDQFKVVAAASPALWTRASDAAPGAFDDADDFRANDVFENTARLSTMRVRVDCGRDDSFFEANRQFASLLPRGSIAHFSSGFHDNGYWRSVAPAQVATILKSFDG